MADSAAALPQASLENGLGLAAEQPRYNLPEQLPRRALAVTQGPTASSARSKSAGTAREPPLKTAGACERRRSFPPEARGDRTPRALEVRGESLITETFSALLGIVERDNDPAVLGCTLRCGWSGLPGDPRRRWDETLPMRPRTARSFRPRIGDNSICHERRSLRPLVFDGLALRLSRPRDKDLAHSLETGAAE
jgi:hypothetical protein